MFTDVPEMSGGWPVLGHMREFQRDPVAMLRRGQVENGEVFQFRIGPRKFVVFAGPDAHHAYFKAPEETLDAKSVYQFTVPIFGRGVAYDVSSELMTEQLGFLFPALRESAMRRYVRIMFEEAESFAGTLGQEGELDLPYAMNELTVNIASRCFLGEEIRGEVDSGFAEAYHDLQNGINTLGFFFPRLPTRAHRMRDRARRKITEIFSGIMRERRRTGARSEDFMQTLMEARYKDGRSLSDDEVTGLLLTSLFAGQHTSAVLATWTGLELHREIPYLGRVRNEMREIHGKEGALSYEGLKQQEVLENAVRECERLHPPLIILIRKALKSLTYGDYTVPAGALAVVAPALSHLLPDVFANPQKFNPDRFAPPASEEKQHPYALIGFGGGKHRCMGKNFAILQVKAIWTVLFDRFDFHSDHPVPAPNYGSWVTGPKLPCRLRYKRRSQASIFH
ncbi:MAG: cytochrome P450 [Gammaproteobacteria bacterium]|nr:cytochrome P450 [Gammaproteobacteria bacterium]MDE0507987.1 cytochrome P450 [Gammaproteobacteria bacterium]MXY90409.1 cytochrome P450 [Gammaproteobacteria bacterium]MYE98662.1 cytochrome P450 [Gammaproteobacteria bacterium]MYG95516.1 cytochrome P450 [Gammaproteobacteria bacterium]